MTLAGWKEGTVMQKLTTLIVGLAMLTACASQRPLSTSEQAALTGAALGAGTGALIGNASGKGGSGAAIGAGLGLLTGALIGSAIENERGERGTPPPAAGSSHPPPTGEPADPQGGVPTPTTGTIDPTEGKFVNGTRWRLEVLVDADPQAPQGTSPIVLLPQESREHNLDLGPHRVIATAFVETQFGARTVGRYDRTVQVDPRGSGWALHFGETSFR